MTPRQKEFCRHYLQGKTAAQAARAAGYAACTAEKNAADILRSPYVYKYLQRHRAAQAVLRRADLEQNAIRLKAIASGPDDRLALFAIREMTRLTRLQLLLPPEPLPEDEETLAPDPIQHPPNTTPETPTTTHEITPQTPENQINETETLQDGKPAYDLTFAPLKPEPVRQPRNLQIHYTPTPTNPSP